MAKREAGDQQADYMKYLYEGSELLLSNQLEEARAALEKAMAIDPEDAKGLSLLGLIYYRLADYPNARDVYEKLVDRFPTEASLRVNLGLVLMMLGETRAAVEHMRAAVEHDPDHQRAHVYLGHLYAELGDNETARKEFMLAGQDHMADQLGQGVGSAVEAVKDQTFGEENLTPNPVAMDPATGERVDEPVGEQEQAAEGQAGEEPESPAEQPSPADGEPGQAAEGQAGEEPESPAEQPSPAGGEHEQSSAPTAPAPAMPALSDELEGLSAPSDLSEMEVPPPPAPPPLTDTEPSAEAGENVESPVEAPAEAPAQPGVPVEAQVETPEETPVETPAETLSEKTPAQAGEPVEAPVQAPVEAQVEAQVETPEETPVETPAETLSGKTPAQAGEPVEAPVQAPVEAQVETPVEAQVEAPVETPEGSPTERGDDVPEAPAEGELPPLQTARGDAHEQEPEKKTGRMGSLPIFAFATRNLIDSSARPEGLTVSGDGSLVAPVTDEIFIRETGLVIHSKGLGFAPASKRTKGQTLDEPVEDAGMGKLLRVSGNGLLVSAPGDGQFTVLELFDDFIYLRQENLFAFDSTLYWENGRIRSDEVEIPLVHLRGEGKLALWSSGPAVKFRAIPNHPVRLPAHYLLGWLGRIVPVFAQPDPSGPLSELPTLICEGEGVLLLRP